MSFYRLHAALVVVVDWLTSLEGTRRVLVALTALGLGFALFAGGLTAIFAGAPRGFGSMIPVGALLLVAGWITTRG